MCPPPQNTQDTVSTEELLGSTTTGEIAETGEFTDTGDTTLEVLTAFSMFVSDAI